MLTDRMYLTNAGQHRIREVMAEKNITQVEIGRKLGVGQSTISNWISGRKPILPSYLREMYKIIPDESIEFLKECEEGDHLYYPKERQRTVPNSPLQLYYSAIDDIFKRIDNNQRREIVRSLDGLVTDFETRYVREDPGTN